MQYFFSQITTAAALFIFLCIPASGQAPPNEFYHSPQIVLPYAHILLTLPDGSHHSIPFTPIVVNNAPIGIDNYTKDIDIRGRLVFAGNGITVPDKKYNAYGTHNFHGHIPLIIYNVPENFQQRYGEKSDLHIRAYEAAQRGAVAMIVFGIAGNPGWNAPFVALPETTPPISIPVVMISYNSGISLFEQSGIFIDFSGHRNNPILEKLEPIEMPIIARISIKGQFSRIESTHYKIRYLPGILTDTRMRKFISNRERALSFIKDILLLQEIDMSQENFTYFPDFASLGFYTNQKTEHTTEWSIFSVLSPHPEQEYKTTYHYLVRELTPRVVRKSWGESIPFVETGLSFMLEQITQNNNDFNIDKTAAEMFKNKRLVPFVETFKSDIELELFAPDSIGCAIGSFYKYLWAAYSQARLKKLYTELPQKEDRLQRINLFEEIYFRDFRSLEREWAEMLAMIYKIPSKEIDYYLEQSGSIISQITSGRIKKLQ